MAVLPLTTLTEKYLGMTSQGVRMYAISALCTGTGAGAETSITIPLKRLKRIKGTPALAIVQNSEAACHNIEATTVTANSIALTIDGDVAVGETITVAGHLFGW